MSKQLAHYSPEDITVIIAGFVQVTGFVAGSFVNITKPTMAFTPSESSDGVVSRTYNESQLYRVTLTLAGTSDSNQTLTYLHRLDEISNIAKFPVIIKDQLGGTLLFASECWIESIPSVTYSEGIDGRDWTIVCAGAVLNVAGNYSQTGVLGDVLNVGAGFLSGVV